MKGDNFAGILKIPQVKKQKEAFSLKSRFAKSNTVNNIVEQDPRFIKKITQLMKGFKAFHSAEATLAGIELHHMLRKAQHKKSANQTIFEQFYRLAA